jgi:hypothetical protein
VSVRRIAADVFIVEAMCTLLHGADQRRLAGAALKPLPTGSQTSNFNQNQRDLTVRSRNAVMRLPLETQITCVAFVIVASLTTHTTTLWGSTFHCFDSGFDAR